MRAVLLSGGVDSAALAVLIRPDYALFVDYGQVCASAERIAAGAIANHLGIALRSIQADCSMLGSGDLSERKSVLNISPSPEWWPYRNQLLATLAGPLALELGIGELMFASVRSDDFHADGTADFFQRLSDLMGMQEGQLRISAPALNLTTGELIERGGAPPDVLGWTHSCHRSNAPCGECRGCNKRSVVLHGIGLWP